MAPKKKRTKSKPAKSKKSNRKKKAAGKSAGKKASVRKPASRAVAKRKSKKSPKAHKKAARTRTRERDQVENILAPPSRSELSSGKQAGDLQGITRRHRADSESVDELLEEGNTFEAGIIEGVEEARDEEPREVHTHQVPEDDVPSEYLDED